MVALLLTHTTIRALHINFLFVLTHLNYFKFRLVGKTSVIFMWILHMLPHTNFTIPVKCLKVIRHRKTEKVAPGSLSTALSLCFPLLPTDMRKYHPHLFRFAKTNHHHEAELATELLFLRINRRGTVPCLQFCDYSRGQTGDLHVDSLFESV